MEVPYGLIFSIYTLGLRDLPVIDLVAVGDEHQAGGRNCESRRIQLRAVSAVAHPRSEHALQAANITEMINLVIG